jgi:hypothetical protein
MYPKVPVNYFALKPCVTFLYIYRPCCFAWSKVKLLRASTSLSLDYRKKHQLLFVYQKVRTNYFALTPCVISLCIYRPCYFAWSKVKLLSAFTSLSLDYRKKHRLLFMYPKVQVNYFALTTCVTSPCIYRPCYYAWSKVKLLRAFTSLSLDYRKKRQLFFMYHKVQVNYFALTTSVISLWIYRPKSSALILLKRTSVHTFTFQFSKNISMS